MHGLLLAVCIVCFRCGSSPEPETSGTQDIHQLDAQSGEVVSGPGDAVVVGLQDSWGPDVDRNEPSDADDATDSEVDATTGTLSLTSLPLLMLELAPPTWSPGSWVLGPVPEFSAAAFVEREYGADLYVDVLGSYSVEFGTPSGTQEHYKIEVVRPEGLWIELSWPETSPGDDAGDLDVHLVAVDLADQTPLYDWSGDGEGDAWFHPYLDCYSQTHVGNWYGAPSNAWVAGDLVSGPGVEAIGLPSPHPGTYAVGVGRYPVRPASDADQPLAARVRVFFDGELLGSSETVLAPADFWEVGLVSAGSAPGEVEATLPLPPVIRTGYVPYPWSAVWAGEL